MTDINDITHQDFSRLLKKFNNLPYIGYKKKHIHNEPTESYFLLVKHIYKLLKSKKLVPIRTQRVKLEVAEKKSTKQINLKLLQ